MPEKREKHIYSPLWYFSIFGTVSAEHIKDSFWETKQHSSSILVAKCDGGEVWHSNGGEIT